MRWIGILVFMLAAAGIGASVFILLFWEHTWLWIIAAVLPFASGWLLAFGAFWLRRGRRDEPSEMLGAAAIITGGVSEIVMLWVWAMIHDQMSGTHLLPSVSVALLVALIGITILSTLYAIRKF